MNARERLNIMLDEQQQMFDYVYESFTKRVVNGEFLQSAPVTEAIERLEAAKDIKSVLEWFTGTDQELARHFMAQVANSTANIVSLRLYGKAAHILLSGD